MRNQKQTTRMGSQVRHGPCRALEGGRQGELDATLMFVDIRGYSGFAEARPPHELHSFIARFACGVSEIVRRRSGTVVELSGDGMLAVFGAPAGAADPAGVAGREASALRAARELVGAAAEILPPLLPCRGLAPLGVGLATGPTFVGAIESGGRIFRTAVGAATNRAARLQSLTRLWDAEIALDEATYRGLTVVPPQLVLHRDVLLRGHSRAANVYSLASHRRGQPAEQSLSPTLS